MFVIVMSTYIVHSDNAVSAAPAPGNALAYAGPYAGGYIPPFEYLYTHEFIWYLRKPHPFKTSLCEKEPPPPPMGTGLILRAVWVKPLLYGIMDYSDRTSYKGQGSAEQIPTITCTLRESCTYPLPTTSSMVLL
jgi:hypothetical protein